MDYIYFNANPSGQTLPDCVTRAISLALNIPYYEVVYLLRQNGLFYDCNDICLTCYERLLDDYFNLEHYTLNSEVKSVEDLAKEYKDKILLLRTNGHLTCSMYGKIYDIFNCTQEIVTDYWVV